MRIVVIGGGITGLAAAWRLVQRSPADVTVLEAGPQAGGHIHTVREGGFVVEAGPNGFLDRPGDPEPMELARDLGIAGSLIQAAPRARRRFVLHRGRLRRVPASPVDLLTSDVLSWAGRLRVLGEPFAPPAPPSAVESVHDFAHRRVGREAADVLVDTAVAGVSAGDSRSLSMAAAFPQLIEMERQHGSLLRAMVVKRAKPPRLMNHASGMGAFIDALASRLGSRLRTGSRVRRLERLDTGWRVALESGELLPADGVLLAVSAAEAAPLVAGLDRELSQLLDSFPFAGLAVVALAFDAGALGRPLDGYGYLVARSERLDTLGVVWDSSIFDGRAREGTVLVRAMLGGARQPDLPELDPSELERRARSELAHPLGINAPPLQSWVWRWPRAIAQYTAGHLDRVAWARTLATRHPGLELCGTSFDGIAFGAAIRSAVTAAERALAWAAVDTAPSDIAGLHKDATRFVAGGPVR